MRSSPASRLWVPAEETAWQGRGAEDGEELRAQRMKMKHVRVLLLPGSVKHVQQGHLLVNHTLLAVRICEAVSAPLGRATAAAGVRKGSGAPGRTSEDGPSMVGSYSSSQWLWMNWIVRALLPTAPPPQTTSRYSRRKAADMRASGKSGARRGWRDETTTEGDGVDEGERGRTQGANDERLHFDPGRHSFWRCVPLRVRRTRQRRGATGVGPHQLRQNR